MQLNITGPTYQHVSQGTNNQLCLNMYPVYPGLEGRGRAPLILDPGLDLLYDLGLGPIRGMITVGSFVYVVSGNTVYRVTINHLVPSATVSSLGTIGTSTGTVYMINNPTQILLTDGSTSGYIITLASGALAVIADADFLGATHITYLDGYFIYCKPSTALMYVSALNDGTSWDALDVATAETRPDNSVGLGISRGELWVFGTDSVEVWYDAANASGFPLSPRVGSQIDIGCKATASIVSINNILMWLDSRGFVVQSASSQFIRENSSGYDIKIASNDALHAEWDTYDLISDAIAMTYNDRGHIMYQITFPTAKKTWVYDLNTDNWHQRSYNNTFLGTQEHHLAQYTTKYINRQIVGGIRDGKLYIQSPTTYDDAGNEIHRIRRTSYLANEFKLFGIDCIEVKIDCGYAEQGTEPIMIMRYSNDNGHTWSNEMYRSFGRVGEYDKRVRWERLGTHYNWLFEFKTVSPTKFAIIDASINVSAMEDY